jgi:hypothetical protein
MGIIQFENKECRRIRAFLDSYLDNELLIETNHEVLKHLENCAECAAVLEGRSRLKQHLQRAVRKDEAPAALHLKIQRQLQEQSSKPRVRWMSWGLAAAAAIVLAVSVWGVFTAIKSGKPLTPAPQAQLDANAQVLTVGLGNHLHCAIDRDFANKHFSDEEMSAKLGDYSGLVSLVKAKIPTGFEVVVGHRCKFNGREFVHLILKKQEQVVSLTLTKKNGEAFTSAAFGEVLQASGIDLHTARLQGYEVTGFSTRDYLAFVVSNLAAQANLEMAQTLAPVMRDFVKRLET